MNENKKDKKSNNEKKIKTERTERIKLPNLNNNSPFQINFYYKNIQKPYSGNPNNIKNNNIQKNFKNNYYDNNNNNIIKKRDIYTPNPFLYNNFNYSPNFIINKKRDNKSSPKNHINFFKDYIQNRILDNNINNFINISNNNNLDNNNNIFKNKKTFAMKIKDNLKNKNPNIAKKFNDIFSINLNFNNINNIQFSNKSPKNISPKNLNLHLIDSPSPNFKKQNNLTKFVINDLNQHENSYTKENKNDNNDIKNNNKNNNHNNNNDNKNKNNNKNNNNNNNNNNNKNNNLNNNKNNNNLNNNKNNNNNINNNNTNKNNNNNNNIKINNNNNNNKNIQNNNNNTILKNNNNLTKTPNNTNNNPKTPNNNNPKIPPNTINMKPNSNSKQNTCYKNYSYRDFPNLEHRQYMEDFYTIIPNFQNDQNKSFFGIFDGHSGSDAAIYLKNNLPKIFQNYLTQTNNDINKSLISSFSKIDNEIMSKFNESGSTCTIIYIFKENNKRIFYCANVGDSKCFLITNKNIKQISIDHNCNDKNEVERIKKNGGIVFSGRVFGTLILTRSIGDKEMKKYGVINEPSIFRKEIDSDDKYLILASDGVWDVVGEDDIFNLSKNNFESEEFCKNVIKMSKDGDTRDNVSCIVIKLN